MDFDRLRDIWSQQPDASSARTDEEWVRLVIARDGALRRRVRTRDFIELGTTCAMGVGFAWKAIVAPVGWPWASAALIIVALGGVFVRERLRHPPPAQLPGDLRDGLVQALTEVDHQVRLLGSVATWYLLPVAAVIVLTIVGSILGRRASIDPAAWARVRSSLVLPLGLVLPIIVLVLGMVWWANRWAVRRLLLPHREELMASLRQLDEAEDEGDEHR